MQPYPVAVHIQHVRHETQTLRQSHFAHGHLPTRSQHPLQSRIERSSRIQILQRAASAQRGVRRVSGLSFF